MIVANVIFNEANLSSVVNKNTNFNSLKVLKTQQEHSYIYIKETETLFRIK